MTVTEGVTKDDIFRANKMEEDEPVADLTQKVVFKRPTKRPAAPVTEAVQADVSSTPAGATFVGSKQVLPEYVVGAKPAKPKVERKPVSSASKASALKLSHLDDEEEED